MCLECSRPSSWRELVKTRPRAVSLPSPASALSTRPRSSAIDTGETFRRARISLPGWASCPSGDLGRGGRAHPYGLGPGLQPLAPGRRLGSASGRRIKGLRRRHPDDRQLQHPRPPARRQRPKKDGRSGCMGRSRGGLTTKIHALVDASGLPIALKLTEGQAHDGRSAATCSVLSPTVRSCRRSRLRQRRPPSGARRAWGEGQHQALAPNQPPGLLPLSLPLPEPRRALLQQTQALPRHRHPLRQGPRQLPGCRQTRFSQNLDAV